MHKQIIAMILVVSTGAAPALGQANLAQTDPSGVHQQGIDLFQKGKFNLAYKYFDNYISENKTEEIGIRTAELAEAEFYKAVCAKETEKASAEKLLLDYIERFPGTAGVYAAYYHIGDLYFGKNNYKDAIQYFQQAEPMALTAAEKDDYTFKYAFSYFALKNFKEAKSRFQPLVQNISSEYHQDAVYYAGLSAYYLQDYKDALNHFKRIEDATKYKTIIPYYIASIQFQNKEYAEMIAYVEPKLESTRGLRYTNEIKKLLGNAYFEQKDYVKSEQYLSESVAALGKVNQEDYYQLGYVYYKNGQYNKAIENLKKLTTLDNEMVQSAMFILGQCYTKTGDKASAKGAFQQAARMKYNSAIAEESAFNIAKLTYDQGNYTEALTLLKSFLNDYPNSSFNNEAQDLLADVFFKTRSYEEAIELIEKMKNPTANIKASYQKMSYYRATEYYANNLLDKADAYLDKSLRFTPETSLEALAYYWKADIAHLKDRYDESNKWLSKFNAIAATISTDHSSRVSSGTGFYLQGYNSYKKKDFVSAQILFAKAVERLKSEKDQAIQQSVYPDAVLRLADSYYMQRKYSDALPYYNTILNNKMKGADYAAYQSAMLKGLTGMNEAKISGLLLVYNTYPNSTYADDALFELGSTYNNLGRSQDAINAYQNLIKSYPKSEFIPFAYNRVGLIQYNMGKHDAALASYKYVIQKYPQTTASQEALIAVKDIYIDKGDAQGYFDLMKQYPGAMVSTSSQDSIVYQAAEAQFIKGNYESAVKGFDSYIRSYPNGAFILPARFYRGESYYYGGNLVAAASDYESVIGQPTNRFTEKSLSRAAVIRYNQGEFAKAAMYYEAMSEVAGTEDNVNEALLGAMRAYFKDKNYSKSVEYANKVVATQGLSETVQSEAVFYRGMANYYAGNVNSAVTDLESTLKRINNEWAAEAKYTLALIAYQKKDYSSAEKLCFEFISAYPSYAKWMVRTYILLSDVYVANNDYFKARVTLQSVLDSYKERDELYKEATEKYNKVAELETQGSKLRKDVGTAGFSEFEK